VERLAAMLVIERRATAARYMCTKCNLMFWGSKKRVKEHLRRIGNNVTGCVCVRCACVHVIFFNSKQWYSKTLKRLFFGNSIFHI
jgi:hypothetical protein